MAVRRRALPPPTVFGSFGHAFGRVWPCFFPLLALELFRSATVGVVQVVAGTLMEAGSATAALLYLASIVFMQLPFAYGILDAHVRAARGESPSFGHLLGGYRVIPAAIASAVLTFVAVGIGLVLLVVPGIYLAVRLAFVTFVVAHERRGPIEAMRESWRRSAGRFWPMLGGALLAAFLGSVSLLIASALVPLVMFSAMSGGAAASGPMVVVLLVGVLVALVLAVPALLFVQLAFASYFVGVSPRRRVRPAEQQSLAEYRAERVLGAAPVTHQIARCECGTRIRVPASVTRKAVRCPRCRGIVHLDQALEPA